MGGCSRCHGKYMTVIAERDRWLSLANSNARLAEDAAHERDEARAKYQFMVNRAADEKLDGYRELASRLAAMEAERDMWIRRAREAVLAMNARPHRRECVRQSAYNIACVCGVSPEDEQP